VEPQREFETSSKASLTKKEVPPVKPRFRPEVSQVIRPRGRQRELVLNVIANVPLEKVKLFSLASISEGRDVTKEFDKTALTLSGSGFRIDLDDRTPSGQYKLTFSFESSAIKSNPGTGDIEFQVRR
jgi:hypothetical protein